MDAASVFRVIGKVQGVAFRAFVRSTAMQYGLKGWVKNNPDGSVVGMVEGDQGLLGEFLKQLKVGNRWSTVESVEIQAQKFSGDHLSFEIRY